MHNQSHKYIFQIIQNKDPKTQIIEFLKKNSTSSDIFQYPKWLAASQARKWGKPIYFVLKDKNSNEIIISASAYIQKAKILGKYLNILHGPIINNSFLKYPHKKYIDNWALINYKDSGLNNIIDQFFTYVQTYCSKNHFFSIIIEPLSIKNSDFHKSLINFGFQRNNTTHSLPNFPIYIDLEIPEKNLIMQLDKKVRYNIRYSKRKNVKIEFHYPQKDNNSLIQQFYNILISASKRQNYSIPNIEFFETVWKKFYNTKNIAIVFAKYNNKIISANFTQFFQLWAGSYYTANIYKYSKLRASYALKWETILEAQKNNCKIFDMWGYIPNIDKSHPAYGFSKFKLRFNGTKKELTGRMILPVNKFKYNIWTNFHKIKKLLNLS